MWYLLFLSTSLFLSLIIKYLICNIARGANREFPKKFRGLPCTQALILVYMCAVSHANKYHHFGRGSHLLLLEKPISEICFVYNRYNLCTLQIHFVKITKLFHHRICSYKYHLHEEISIRPIPAQFTHQP